MHIINCINVNDGWVKARNLLEREGIARPSRAGDVLEVPEPVTTVYANPTQRVLFDPLRNANPFFHLFEGLWMLAGRNDVAWISQYNENFKQYSDDQKIFHGAYGYRWRHNFGKDQLPIIVDMLKSNHAERRAVLQMWDPVTDLAHDGVDIPCNTTIYFKVRDNKLLMTVCCRSNDIIFGCYGANAVHMSMLQEYMAAMIGVHVDLYHQISDSWHAYKDKWEKFKKGSDKYEFIYRQSWLKTGKVTVHPLVEWPETFDSELTEWMAGEDNEVNNSFFHNVASPMRRAYQMYKKDDIIGAMAYLSTEEQFLENDVDWLKAGYMWLERIKQNREKKK